MTKTITNKEFNEVLNQVTNYLAWETDSKKIESAIRFYAYFQEAVDNRASKEDIASRKVLLDSLITRYAS
jgi:hypothetical protein